jgi:hypothetical protein
MSGSNYAGSSSRCRALEVCGVAGCTETARRLYLEAGGEMVGACALHAIERGLEGCVSHQTLPKPPPLRLHIDDSQPLACVLCGGKVSGRGVCVAHREILTTAAYAARKRASSTAAAVDVLGVAGVKDKKLAALERWWPRLVWFYRNRPDKKPRSVKRSEQRAAARERAAAAAAMATPSIPAPRRLRNATPIAVRRHRQAAGTPAERLEAIAAAARGRPAAQVVIKAATRPRAACVVCGEPSMVSPSMSYAARCPEHTNTTTKGIKQ